MDVKEAIQEAARAAEYAPEDLREAAFKIILERLLGNDVGEPGMGRAGGGGGQMQESSGGGERDPEELGRIPEAHVVKHKGDRGQQAIWAVMTLHASGVEVTTEAIIKVIRSQLGVAPQSVANTGRTLRELTPRFVMRRDRPEGKGYVYEPTARSVEIFEDLA